jgi:hypothetical protein
MAQRGRSNPGILIGYRLKLGLKKNEIVFLSYPEDLEA